jgi:hypothetical protein
MQRHKRLVLFAAIFSLALMSGTSRVAISGAKGGGPERIRFEVVTFAERNGRRDLLSQTLVDGPSGTDFTVNLHDSRFQMNAKFVTDLIAPGTLKIKTDLNTRRLYGYSERSLPLYEEDAQKETMQLGFDEKLVLLPFGRNDNNDQLEIEITAAVSKQSTYLASGELRPLEITIPKQSPGGAISVEAFKTPHNYLVEATLLEDGREVAHETGDYHIDEPAELLLGPGLQAGPTLNKNPLAINLTIYRYLRTGSKGQVAFGFNAYRREEQNQKGEVVVPQAAGIVDMNSALSYELGEFSGRKYQLVLTVKLAPGENAN